MHAGTGEPVAAMSSGARRRLEGRDADRSRRLSRARIVLDASRFEHPDLGLLDALARAQLLARRSGRQLVLADASVELRNLIALAGLERVLVCSPPGAGDDEAGSSPPGAPRVEPP